MNSFSLNIFLLIFLLGAVHGILHALIILSRKSKKEAHFIFGLLILSISLACFKTALQEVFPAFWSQFPVPFLFQFAWGPLLLLYTQSTLYRGFRFQKAHLTLFVPSLIFDVLFVVASQGASVDTDLRSDISFLVDFVAMIYFLYFISRSIATLASYKKGVDEFYSNISAETINWLVSLYIICGVMLGGGIFYLISTVWLRGYDFPFANMKTYYPVYLWFSGSIYYLIHRWYQSPTVQRISQPAKSQKPNKKPVYDPQEVLKEVRLNKHYQDPKLTLKKLANRLQLNINDLSQTINTGLNQSFNDFVNELRVDEVKRKMADSEYSHLSQLGIALESGFNSKATFNRAFKRFTGMNPSEYQKKMTKKESQMPI